MQRIRPLLVMSGVPASEVGQWTSHCFRRGSGIDVLEHQGINAMVAHRGWASPKSAEPYANADEQRAVTFAAAQLIVDDSDDKIV